MAHNNVFRFRREAYQVFQHEQMSRDLSHLGRPVGNELMSYVDPAMVPGDNLAVEHIKMCFLDSRSSDKTDRIDLSSDCWSA